MTVAALIVAAGRGTRAGRGEVPKQYVSLAGEPMIVHAIRPFLASGHIDIVQVVVGAQDGPRFREFVAPLDHRIAAPAGGGDTRQVSVFNGLQALAARAPRHVLIHDAARPLVGADVIERVIEALDHCLGAIAADPVSDTLKRAGRGGAIEATINRAGLWRAQTPQGFDFARILDAHRRANADGLDHFTDDAALAAWAGIDVALVPGSPLNIKVTTAEDLAMAERLLAYEPRLETRTGSGFDVHRFASGDHVWLCGVRVPHTHKLEGHSDADVGLHALTDAILGALGEGDIGEHFPPSDMRWKGEASSVFVRDAVSRVAARRGRILNVDVTLLCETPKIAPHRAAMRAAIADLLGIDAARVSVKATTMESLGFIGRREGIAAMATATVLLPP